MVQLTKNIETLIEEGGEMTVGRLSPFDCVATATDDADVCLAMLVRRDGETLNQLIKRLDRAIHLAWTDDRFIDEVNDGPSDLL
jgi:hypothetical protein